MQCNAASSVAQSKSLQILILIQIRCRMSIPGIPPPAPYYLEEERGKKISSRIRNKISSRIRNKISSRIRSQQGAFASLLFLSLLPSSCLSDLLIATLPFLCLSQLSGQAYQTYLLPELFLPNPALSALIHCLLLFCSYGWSKQMLAPLFRARAKSGFTTPASEASFSLSDSL